MHEAYERSPQGHGALIRLCGVSRAAPFSAINERRRGMRSLLLGKASLLLFLMASFAGLPLTLALGHEAHHAECNETAVTR